MIGWIAGRARCLTGEHKRSASRAFRPEGSEKFESVCVYCGVPMVRLAKRNWIVKPRGGSNS